jgi:hypothetical protein
VALARGPLFSSDDGCCFVTGLGGIPSSQKLVPRMIAVRIFAYFEESLLSSLSIRGRSGHWTHNACPATKEPAIIVRKAFESVAGCIHTSPCSLRSHVYKICQNSTFSNPTFTVGSSLACPTTHRLSSSLARATRSAFLSSAFYLFAVHWYSILPQDVAAALGISVLVRAPAASFRPYQNTSQYRLYLKAVCCNASFSHQLPTELALACCYGAPEVSAFRIIRYFTKPSIFVFL